ncbi:MAG TPA: hypothetical protein VH988_07230 [Thermoanaerobaculia bacterium]|jgi:hypothetical protein|nr:hypothetical protein [Thermoanaerobaculia bacterium]
MAFKLKDLLIHVLPSGAHCGPATIEPAAAAVHCGPATIEPAAAVGGHCGPATIEPAAFATTATLATLATLAFGTPGAQDLAMLKRILQDTLIRLEGQDPASLPQTVAEAEDLESRLKAALDALAEHKKTLGS